MSEITKTKKVIKKIVTVGGDKVPLYICPPGMSGLGVDLSKHFNQEDKEEVEFEVVEDIDVLEKNISEDRGFNKAFQQYCDEGEVITSEIEDYINYKQTSKYYDEKLDRNKDLVSIYGDNY